MNCALAAALLAAAWLAGGTEPKAEGPARDCAAGYFEALIEADVDRANALVDVPYSFDRKEILRSKEEVEKRHRAIAAKKGKRPVPEYTVTVPRDAPALDRNVFPEYLVFRINLADRKDHVDVYVTKGASPKVIGFSD